MKNPLKKRLPREFIGDFGKYLDFLIYDRNDWICIGISCGR